MSGILSLERSEQILCSGLCNSAPTSIVYLFTSFLGSDVNVETRCIVYRVSIHILICTLNVREGTDVDISLAGTDALPCISAGCELELAESDGAPDFDGMPDFQWI